MVTISIIPIGLVVFETGIDLNWIFYSGAIVTIPCFPAVILSIIWVKATGKGLISGIISYLHTHLMYLVQILHTKTDQQGLLCCQNIPDTQLRGQMCLFRSKHKLRKVIEASRFFFDV